MYTRAMRARCSALISGGRSFCMVPPFFRECPNGDGGEQQLDLRQAIERWNDVPLIYWWHDAPCNTFYRPGDWMRPTVHLTIQLLRGPPSFHLLVEVPQQGSELGQDLDGA